MPKFILNVPAEHWFNQKASDFERGYIEAMFFTNGDTGLEDEHLLNELGVGALTRQSIRNIQRVCRAFVTAHAELLFEATMGSNYTWKQAGRDFWITRQGHGTGYWDRDELPERLQEELTEAAKSYSEHYVTVHRGRVHA